MLGLMMDTSFRQLNLALYQENQLIDALQVDAFKQQSEWIMTEIDKLFKKHGFLPHDLTEIVLTDGPGSYTGLRISMTIAKVIAGLAPIKVYTLSSLQLFAGTLDDVIVLMDAKAKRFFFGHYQKGERLEECVLPLEQLEDKLVHATIIGDTEHAQLSVSEVKVAENCLALRTHWKLVEDVHGLVPRYVVENEVYQ